MRLSTLCAVVCLLGLTMASGCALGPSSLKMTRTDYNKSVQETNYEELLLNLVRLRYLEQPFFLNVGAISSTFNYGTSGQGGLDWYDVSNPSIGTVLEYTLGLSGSRSEVPTVSFAPLQGEGYVNNVLANIGQDRLILLSRSGWALGDIMRVLVHTMGPLENQPVRTMMTGKEDSFLNFIELSNLMDELEAKGELELLIAAHKDGTTFPAIEVHCQDQAKADRMAELLHLSQAPECGKPFLIELASHMGHSAAKKENKGIPSVPLKLRNLMEVMTFLSIGVQAPEEDIAEGVVYDYDDRGDLPLTELFKDLLSVKSSSIRPSSAFVSVNYRDRWFYIADTDLSSKLAMGFLSTIVSLQSGEVPSVQPVLTLNIGD